MGLNKSPCGAEEKDKSDIHRGEKKLIYIILRLLSIQPENVKSRLPRIIAEGTGTGVKDRLSITTPPPVILGFMSIYEMPETLN